MLPLLLLLSDEQSSFIPTVREPEMLKSFMFRAMVNCPANALSVVVTVNLGE